MVESRAERLAGALRRVAGLALLLTLPLLALETFLLAYGDPQLYAGVAGFWATPSGRAVAILLVAALSFHGADGLRAVAVDAWPRARRGGLLAASFLLAGLGAAVGAFLVLRPGVMA